MPFRTTASHRKSRAAHPRPVCRGAGPGRVTAELDFEALAAAQPDLLLASWTVAATYETMSAIAPTLVYKNVDATTWQEIQRIVGTATGRTEKAEAVIAET